MISDLHDWKLEAIEEHARVVEAGEIDVQCVRAAERTNGPRRVPIVADRLAELIHHERIFHAPYSRIDAAANHHGDPDGEMTVDIAILHCAL
jgi:hypothetical protein